MLLCHAQVPLPTLDRYLQQSPLARVYNISYKLVSHTNLHVNILLFVFDLVTPTNSHHKLH
jgi:hypothetical protein